jgi:hypothetical protein
MPASELFLLVGRKPSASLVNLTGCRLDALSWLCRGRPFRRRVAGPGTASSVDVSRMAVRREGFRGKG